MNILFLSYWGANEGLSQSTVNPHLEILTQFKEIDKIIYVSIERSRPIFFLIPQNSKVDHIPFYTDHGFINKFKDFLLLPLRIKNLQSKYGFSFLIARSSLAGGILFLYTFLLNKRIPWYIESFDPHAEYMRESGIWKRTSISFQTERFFEKQILKRASGVFPVSNAYANQLKMSYPDQWIKYAPCAVNISDFRFNEYQRSKIRSELNISDNSKVGIYVGKFGGNYLDQEAFNLFQLGFDHVESFHLIILTPNNKEEIISHLKSREIEKDRYSILFANFSEVPDYLSAADFAFALYKQGSSKKAISPIKVGEYWASGLPVVITSGIGDEDSIMDQYPILGTKFELNELSMISALNNIKSRLNNRIEIASYASKFRNFEIIQNIYKKIIVKHNPAVN